MRIIVSLAIASPWLILAFLAWIAPHLDDINDAPCLVCGHHSCMCGE